jgi:hypothetical protein
MFWEQIQRDQERERPYILRHRHNRPVIYGLGDQSNPEVGYHARNGAWDCQEVSLEGRESESIIII